MISRKLLEIEHSIRSLSLEEQKWLNQQITKQIQQRTQTKELFADSSYMENQLKEMANDPDIQSEIAAINEEFAVTEINGL